MHPTGRLLSLYNISSEGCDDAEDRARIRRSPQADFQTRRYKVEQLLDPQGFSANTCAQFAALMDTTEYFRISASAAGHATTLLGKESQAPRAAAFPSSL